MNARDTQILNENISLLHFRSHINRVNSKKLLKTSFLDELKHVK